MFNNDKADINYQLSNSNRDIRIFNRKSLDCDYSSYLWHKARPDLNVTNSPLILNGMMLPKDSKECQTSSVIDNSKMEFLQLLTQANKSHTMVDSVPELVSEPRSKLRPPKFLRPKITAMRIKTLMTNDILKNLPFDIQQHLISLMPDCDKIVTGPTSDNKQMFLSNTALTNEFFHKALIRFMCKLTSGKSLLSTESFVNRIKSFSATKPNTVTSNSIVNESPQDTPITTMDTQLSNSSTIRLDYDISDAKVNYKFEVETPIVEASIESNNLLDLKKENEVFSPNYCCDSSFLYNIDTSSANTLHNSEFATDISSNQRSSSTQNPSNDSMISPRSGNYKRRNTGGSLPPTPNKRPTRSTAGQLPARLKSSSPQPGSQATIITTLLNNSHLPKASKSISGRKRTHEKRKYKMTEYGSQNNNGVLEMKPITFHNDTILLNLRAKLSNRIQTNSLKYYQDQCQRSGSRVEFSSDINSFHSKSPRSLSPESDKLPFINSPISKNGQNNLRHLKLRNPFFDNQTPTSPQWSFSSEFTSQSSVESVLSQKNIRIEIDDVSGFENLLDDIDCEEMPPPRRTLTVAAMREKMRAKKMAKEEKRKDFDKDFSFDVDKIENSSVKISEENDMSHMMSLSQETDDNDDDDNIANDFDSFLIDDYHVEIDDKILNYSDDLDDLLLSGGNESLLEIIMKDPDVMEITNDNFSILNSDCHHQNLMVSSDQTKCSFSNSNIDNPCNAFNNPKSEISSLSPLQDYKLSLPVSSVCRIDDSILSQALTSVIQNVGSNRSSSKDSGAIKSALQNAYLVDGNGLSDALKLIQSLHPEAKVTTQQFFLVNSGPQLVLSQAPPTQVCPSGPISIQSPVKSNINSTQIITEPTAGPTATRCEPNNKTSIATQPLANTLMFTNTKPSASAAVTTTFTQPPMFSSTLSMLPQFSAFNTTQSNIYSVNSNFTNKIVSPITNLGCKFPTNNIQYHPTTSNANFLGNQKPISSNQQSSQNAFGIRLQLAQNYQSPQQLNILQSSQGQMLPTLMNQPLQFLTPQHHNNNILNNNNNNNISLITQAQPMSKLVLLYPNLNCPQISSDISHSLKNESQQVILLSQAPKDQSTPISLSNAPTFQVLNWQQINPNLNTLLGSTNGNNLVLMNPQALNSPPFSFNYQQPPSLFTSGSNSLLMMSTAQNVLKPTQIVHQQSPPKPLTSAISSLSVSVKTDDENVMKPHLRINSNISVEQLSNSSSSANSKLSFDDKSSCQLSKSFSDNFTDSDQEKSISSPQFQLLNTMEQHNNVDFTLVNNNNNKNRLSTKCLHLTVDIDSSSSSSPSHSNSCYRSNKNPTKSNTCVPLQSPEIDYDQTDFEIPCLYSQKIEDNNNKNNNIYNDDINISHKDYFAS